MRKPVLLALSLAFLVSAQSALAAGDAGNFGTPIKSGVSVSFIRASTLDCSDSLRSASYSSGRRWRDAMVLRAVFTAMRYNHV